MKQTVYIILCVLLPFLSGWAEWREAVEMSEARRGHCAAAVDGKIYVFGGMGSRMRAPLSSAECYDPAADEWTEIAAMPVRLHYAAAAAYDGRIYIFGGDTLAGAAGSNVYRYDPETDEYEAVAVLPTGLAGHSAVTLGQRILIIGGLDGDGNYVQGCTWFDPDSQVMDDGGPELGQPRINFGAANLGRLVIAAGGIFHGPLYQAEQFTGRRWESMANLPLPRGGLAAAFLDSNLVVVGGRHRMADAVDGVIGHRLGGDGWFIMEPLNHARLDFALVELDGRLYAIGGASTAEHQMRGVMATVEVLDEVVGVSEYDPGLPQTPSLTVYPNPVNGWAAFALPGGAARITIYNSLGQPVADARFTSPAGAWHWNSAPFPAGVYYYRITSLGRQEPFTGNVSVLK